MKQINQMIQIFEIYIVDFDLIREAYVILLLVASLILLSILKIRAMSQHFLNH